MKSLKISFREIVTTNIVLDYHSLPVPGGDATVTTQLTGHLDKNDRQRFSVRFEVSVEGPDKSYSLIVKTLAFFECDEAYDDDFSKSTFFRMNAPAIAYPYVRSFISTLTLNAGIPPLILPTYNFVNSPMTDVVESPINEGQVPKISDLKA